MDIMIELKNYQNTVRNYNDEVLVEHLGKLFQREKRIGDAILINLQEISFRRLYAKLGYNSLFDLLVKRFGHSETAAYQRTSALKLIQEVPSAQKALAQGETTMSTMAKTQNFIKKLEKDQGTTLTTKEKEELFEQVKGKTQKEAQLIFADINPVAALPTSKEKPLTSTHSLLQVTVEQETLNLINEIKTLLSHEIPDGNLNQVLKKMAQVSLEKFKKAKGFTESRKQFKQDEITVKSELTEAKKKDHRSVSQGNSRNIPIHVRREVFRRAEGRCEYVGSDGHRCNSEHQLQVDHIKAWSQGGGHELENVRALCRSHNYYRTKETHGFWYQKLG